MKRWSGMALVGAIVMIACGLTFGGLSNDRAKPQASSPLQNVAFLAGTWRGTVSEDEFVEEIWSEPSPAPGGDTMVGVFRWLNAQGRPRMYELLTLSHEEGETILRLRHYTAKMIAWEEKDAPVTLRLAEIGPGRAVFRNLDSEARLSRIVFHQKERSSLAIDVKFREGMGEPLNFQFTRAK